MDMPEPAGHAAVPRDITPEQPYAAAVRLSRKAQIGVLLAVAALLAAGVVVGPSLLRTRTDPKEEPAAQTLPDGSFRPTPRQWATLTIAPVRQMTFRAAEVTDGKIANDDDLTTPVYSPFTGRVTKLFAKAGDHVERGAPLLAVQATEFVQGLNDLVSAAATLKTARAQLVLAQANEKRQHALFQAQGAAQKDWQQSQVDLATAEGGLRSAEIALAAVRNRLRILGKTDEQIDAMETATDLQRFNPEALVVAPISGTVVQRQVGLGQNIVSQSNGGSTPVFSIGDMSKVWLLANVREIDAPLVHVGDPVEVHVLAWPGRVFNARISYVAPSIDPATHRLPVRAEVDNPDGALKPEMFASFDIITGAGGAAPAVPDGAVVHEGSDAHVWVAHPKDRTIVSRPIRTGRVSDGMVQVTSGLHAGEQVVTRGSLFIDRATTGD